MGRKQIPADIRLERFREIEPETGCWLWTSSRDRNGYGRIHYLGHMVATHRLAAHIYLGMPLDSKSHVLHSCDTPHCFNPAHLREGTPLENARDRENRGRGNHEKIRNRTINIQSKLMERNVRTIRRLLRRGILTERQIAEVYGVTSNSIHAIKKGQNWKHVSDFTYEAMEYQLALFLRSSYH